MEFCHAAGRTQAIFDDEHVISYAVLAPALWLAQWSGLGRLVGEHVALSTADGVNAPAKVTLIVAGMAYGADSIEDLDRLRHGGMDKMFAGIRAPSTLGRSCGHAPGATVRQLDKVARQVLVVLATHTPLLPGKRVLAFLDIDSMQRRTYGYAKQGSGFGHTKIQGKSVLIRGLNALTVTLSTPLSAPVAAAGRLRGGTTGSARGTASAVRESIGTTRQGGLHRHPGSARRQRLLQRRSSSCRPADPAWSYRRTWPSDPAPPRAMVQAARLDQRLHRHPRPTRRHSGLTNPNPGRNLSI